MGVLNESASPTNAETLSSQEAAKFVLVWINLYLIINLTYFLGFTRNMQFSFHYKQ